jgi:hypothetical protein
MLTYCGTLLFYGVQGDSICCGTIRGRRSGRWGLRCVRGRCLRRSGLDITTRAVTGSVPRPFTDGFTVTVSGGLTRTRGEDDHRPRRHIRGRDRYRAGYLQHGRTCRKRHLLLEADGQSGRRTH